MSMAEKAGRTQATSLQRLKQRKLVQWTLAYIAAAAALFGTLATIGEVFGWPSAALRAVFFLLLAGVGATVVIAWFHGDRGRQRVNAMEVVLLLALTLLGAAGAAHSVLASRPVESGSGALLVLPFRDVTPDSSQQYLADGIAEELRRALTRTLDMRVARGGAPQRGSHVLHGTVQRVRGSLRITARLDDDAGRAMWHEQFDLVDSDLFAIEERIAAAVAARLRPHSELPVAFSAPRAPDPRAHDHYLRGEHALKRRSPAAVIQAISEYRSAAAIDPAMSAAVAREAYAYALFIDWGWTYPGLSDEHLMQRGLELANRALALDSVSAEAWLARAYLLQLRDPHRMSGATQAFARAVALDPANAESQHQYGQTLMILGRYAEARLAYHAALALEPDRPLTLVPLAAIALREGDVAGARRWADSAVALAPQAAYPWASRAQLRLGLGDAAGARADAEQALRIDPSYELPGRSGLAAALGALGDTAAAAREFERARRAVVDGARPSPTEAYYLAASLTRLNRTEAALHVIETARPRGAWLWFYLQSPVFEPLHDAERMRRVLADCDPRPAPPGT